MLRKSWTFLGVGEITEIANPRQSKVSTYHSVPGGVFKHCFYFHPICVEVIEFDEYIFQMGGATTN